MLLKHTAFYESLQEMKNSYASDLQMIGNYEKVLQAEVMNSGDHISLLKNQLSLMIETIEELVKLR